MNAMAPMQSAAGIFVPDTASLIDALAERKNALGLSNEFIEGVGDFAIWPCR